MNKFETPNKEDPNKPKGIETDGLSFSELQETLREVNEVARNSFIETERGFQNAQGDGITVFHSKERGARLGGISRSLPDYFHKYMFNLSVNSPLKKGSKDKEEVMEAVRKMIKELGGRVIE